MKVMSTALRLTTRELLGDGRRAAVGVASMSSVSACSGRALLGATKRFGVLGEPASADQAGTLQQSAVNTTPLPIALRRIV